MASLCVHRYRNFRTFTSPRPVQFSSLAVDFSGELVSAGAQDSFEIFIWSMQTGRLLEVSPWSQGRPCAVVKCVRWEEPCSVQCIKVLQLVDLAL